MSNQAEKRKEGMTIRLEARLLTYREKNLIGRKRDGRRPINGSCGKELITDWLTSKKKTPAKPRANRGKE